MDMDMDMDMMMQMWFYASADCTILFEFWHVNTWHGMLVSCLLMYLLAIAYEGLKVGRAALVSSHPCDCAGCGSGCGINDSRTPLVKQNKIHTALNHMFTRTHLLQTFLHIVQVSTSYMLMLAFMTYNVWIALSIILGVGTGYLLWAWKRETLGDLNEHCH